MSPLTLGVFDSGFGGLTVLRELLPLVPGAHFLYLGDTARLPYGAKSRATVARYAVEAARFLVAQGAGLLVIACNTATALALDDIRAAVPVPVVGVIEPGARACLAALDEAHNPLVLSTEVPLTLLISTEASLKTVLSTEARRGGETRGTIAPRTSPPFPPNRDVLVLATAATVASHAYRDTCAGLGLKATEKACPLLVPLIEEGWTDHPVTREVLSIYLDEALAELRPGAVLLGCTHYPLLSAEIRKTLAARESDAVLIDSALATARAVQLQLGAFAAGALDTKEEATFTCFATDSVEKFARLGSLFLDRPLPEVHLLDLGG